MLTTMKRPLIRLFRMGIFGSTPMREHVEVLSREFQPTSSPLHTNSPRDMQRKVQKKLDDPGFFSLKEANINSEAIAQFDRETLEMLKHTAF